MKTNASVKAPVVKVSGEVTKRFPALETRAFVVSGLNNAATPRSLEGVRRNAEKYAESHYDIDTRFKRFVERERITPWRKANANRRGDSSAEGDEATLLEKTVCEIRIPDNPKASSLQKICCIASVWNAVPVIAFDLRKVKGNVVFRKSPGNEEITVLEDGKKRGEETGKEKTEKTIKGEIVCADDEKVLCRQWNLKPNKKAAVTRDTRDAVVIAQTFGKKGGKAVKTTAEDLRELIGLYCSDEEE